MLGFCRVKLNYFKQKYSISIKFSKSFVSNAKTFTKYVRHISFSTTKICRLKLQKVNSELDQMISDFTRE